jgi:hypothetical protein
MNENWPRWFFASISKHFDDNTTYKMFVEGEPRETWDTQDFFECRIDGPDFTNLSKHLWLAIVEVNILVQSVVNFEDMHRIHTMAGEAAAAFDTPLVIYQYGDDDAVLACLELIQEARTKESIIISHFGRINPDQPLLQATVGGRFKTNLVTV